MKSLAGRWLCLFSLPFSLEMFAGVCLVNGSARATCATTGCTSFLKAGHLYDIDGDGQADTSAEILGSYFAWSPAFASMMRAKLGADAIILANSAGSVSDPALSGVSIEMEACVGSRGGRRKCADALTAQRVATESTGRTAASVLWLTHSESMSPAEQCREAQQLQRTYPWVQIGTDFFDGSHIVC